MHVSQGDEKGKRRSRNRKELGECAYHLRGGRAADQSAALESSNAGLEDVGIVVRLGVTSVDAVFVVRLSNGHAGDGGKGNEELELHFDGVWWCGEL